jgi:hypothetical protein
MFDEDDKPILRDRKTLTDYALVDPNEPAGSHPDLATHNTLGLATQQELDDHALTPHGGSHPDLATHDTLGLATQAELDGHESAPDPHTGYALSTELSTHEGAADPHTVYERESQKGVANGYASLDGSGLVPDAQIPAAIARDSELHAQLHASAHLSGGNDAIFAETVPTTAAFGDTAAQGADATKVAKLLHRHGMPANPVTAHEAAGDPHTGYQRESEKGAASGYASLDAGTLVPFAQLGSGSADGTKFLRDDRTWITPSAAPSPDARLVVAELAADHAISSTTGTEAFAIALGIGTWAINMYLMLESATTTVGPMIGLNFDGTATVKSFSAFWPDGSTALSAYTDNMDDEGVKGLGVMAGMATKTYSTTAPNLGTTVGVTTINSLVMMHIRGIMVVTAAGNLEVWHSSETASSTTLKAKSSIVAIKTSV